MGKLAGLALVLIIATSSVMVIRRACSVPTPSIPEFTLKLVEHLYDVPPVYSKDPYTGKSVVTEAGYHMENRSIEVTIKNQPFTPYYDANSALVSLYYYIGFKGHFEDRTFDPNNTGNYFLPSDSDYTVISFALGENSQYADLREIPPGGQIDFQVEATVGHFSRIYGTPTPPWPESYYDVFISEANSLSSTQTVTVYAHNPGDATAVLLLTVAAVVAANVCMLISSKKSRREVMQT